MLTVIFALAVSAALFDTFQWVTGTAPRKERCSGEYVGPLAEEIQAARSKLTCYDWYTALALERLEIPECDHVRRQASASGQQPRGVCRHPDECWDLDATPRLSLILGVEIQGAIVDCPVNPARLLETLSTQASTRAATRSLGSK